MDPDQVNFVTSKKDKIFEKKEKKIRLIWPSTWPDSRSIHFDTRIVCRIRGMNSIFRFVSFFLGRMNPESLNKLYVASLHRNG